MEGAGARTVVFGYGELAVASVYSLKSAGADLVAAVIPSNRTGQDVEQFKAFAEQQQLPVLIQPPRKAVEPFVRQLRELQPDFLLVWSYPMILPKSVIEVPKRGAFNMHGGVLPEYRGGHVMQWAIINGEKETGMTLHYIDEGIDTGPIVAESRFSIDWHDDAAVVRDKLKSAGSALLKEWWPAVLAGRAPRRTQDESRARYYRLRTQEDGLIQWSQSNISIYNLVRALVSPWPGAYTFHRSCKLTIWKVEPIGESGQAFGGEVGQVVGIGSSGVIVRTGEGVLAIRSIEYEGGILNESAVSEVLTVGDLLGR